MKRSKLLKHSLYMLVGFALLGAALTTNAQTSQTKFFGEPYRDGDVYADTWVATDALGRDSVGVDECGPVKKDKWVGIFYWTWHTPGRGGPNDNTKLLAAASNGVVNWPTPPQTHHWGEPELGYYLMTDPFVIRKHASLLVDAGVDAVFFDTTNPPFTWKDEYEALCKTYTQMRQEGARTPSICFIAPFGDPRPVTDRLWNDLYKPGLWKDLWFQWDGKPLVLANKDYIKDPEQLAFFTFRRPMPDYWQGPSGPDQWSWLETYPQHVFKNSKGENEQMSVGVAHNALPNTPGPVPMSHKRGAMGRSWHDGKKDARDGAVNLGLNFDEQWRRALEVDPSFIFVTGWNEWIAGRYFKWHIYTDADCIYPGGMFVDQYNHEYSRDSEPMRGGHTDNYYYQLANWVRQFKGVRERPKANGPSAITIDGAFGDWQQAAPEFRDTIGDVAHRHFPGYGDLVYTNTTGRNDFVICKAAYDESNLYFFAQTRDKITPYTDPHWMYLLIDADQDAQTGWLGYDFIVNLEPDSTSETSVHQWKNGAWAITVNAAYRVNGNGIEISLDRKAVGLDSDAPAFDFHWADNIQSFGGVEELGLNGDSAPNRRWNYRFESK
ncbi:MAG: hypothetical protein P9L94_13845 [Candidatus Hinthialibacter antarcticus]|nr:hypothetical protein [Candidatus Hinthialibacter antarcticus]